MAAEPTLGTALLHLHGAHGSFLMPGIVVAPFTLSHMSHTPTSQIRSQLPGWALPAQGRSCVYNTNHAGLHQCLCPSAPCGDESCTGHSHTYTHPTWAHTFALYATHTSHICRTHPTLRTHHSPLLGFYILMSPKPCVLIMGLWEVTGSSGD